LLGTWCLQAERRPPLLLQGQPKLKGPSKRVIAGHWRQTPQPLQFVGVRFALSNLVEQPHGMGDYGAIPTLCARIQTAKFFHTKEER